MEMQQNKLDELKGRNPFKFPDGYMEGLTERIMAQIPQASSHAGPKVVSLRERIRPWLYLAGVFAGLLIFFRLIISPVSPESDNADDIHLYLHALVTGELSQTVTEDELDYLEYMESQYLDRAFAEEIDFMEE